MQILENSFTRDITVNDFEFGPALQDKMLNNFFLFSALDAMFTQYVN